MAAHLLEPSVENPNVTRLVPALPRQFQPQLPGSVRIVDQTLRCNVDAGDLIAHVTVDHFTPGGVGKAVLLGPLHVAAHDGEATVARGFFAEPELTELEV